MKIRVTLLLLLCTRIAADSKNTIEDQRTSSNSEFQDKKIFIKRFLPRHRVYEYSKSMEALKVDSSISHSDGGRQMITPDEDFADFSSGDLGEESGRSSQQLPPTIRMNSKQPSQIFEDGLSPVGENKVLSRKKKDKMEQALLALLMAYKMKFAALIPILLGGMSLLASTTALAGFFFALFAAVLGLKTH